ncbi:MAG: DUF1049 domain-containing protein [Alphaproteobacteria bacterium]|nr:DUF1049 domain-containing protein [Alphaproteobacteria bacterium]
MTRRSRLARAFTATVTLPLTLLVIVFAISNRGPVAIGLWPFDEIVEMPVYLLALGALLLGFLGGAALAGFGTLAARLRARREAKRAENAEQRLASEESQRAADAAQSAHAVRTSRANAIAHSVTGSRW